MFFEAQSEFIINEAVPRIFRGAAQPLESRRNRLL